MEDFTENSIDLEDTREDYKNELIMLHVSLKALNRDVDLSAILNPLLAETGPAITHVPKLAKQKYINEEKAKAQSPAQTSGGSACSAPAQTSAAAPRQRPARDGPPTPRGRGGRRRTEPPLGIVPQEVVPSWGELKRYAVMDCATYASVEATARGQITNNYLHFENIRQAALPGNFNLILIG
jgi:hypothetical protein